MNEEARIAAARGALTDTQFLTWFLYEHQGLSPRSIAAYRRVTKKTVVECLDICEYRIEEALNGKDQQSRGEREEGGKADHRAVQG